VCEAEPGPGGELELQAGERGPVALWPRGVDAAAVGAGELGRGRCRARGQAGRAAARWLVWTGKEQVRREVGMEERARGSRRGRVRTSWGQAWAREESSGGPGGAVRCKTARAIA
jgi:hypothetical protein